MSSRCRLAGLVLTASVLGWHAGFQPRGATLRAQPPSTAPLTPADATSATYRGVGDLAGPITLTNGTWTGTPFVPGGASRPSLTLLRQAFATGDLDGDGTAEAAVLVGLNSGGSGELIYLAILQRQGPGVVNVATGLVGDRVGVRAMRIAGRRIELDVVQAGPGDAQCCPGELASRAWELRHATLVELPASVTGRLSLETISGIAWTLVSLAFDEPAPPEPPVTLRIDGVRIAGSSGCNNYFATITPASSPGAVAISGIAGTRKMCEEPVMVLEQRVLAQFATVRRFSFVGGQLALSYERDGTYGVMLFSAGAPGHTVAPPRP